MLPAPNSHTGETTVDTHYLLLIFNKWRVPFIKSEKHLTNGNTIMSCVSAYNNALMTVMCFFVHNYNSLWWAIGPSVI